MVMGRHDSALRHIPWTFRSNGTVGQGLTRMSSDENTDWGLLVCRIATARDKNAFAALFAHFAPRVKGYLMKSGADAASAEECAQDVMVTVWRKADSSIRSVPLLPHGCLPSRGTDASTCCGATDAPTPKTCPGDRKRNPTRKTPSYCNRKRTQLTEALKTLPEGKRSMIERAYFNDLSHSEISAATGFPLARSNRGSDWRSRGCATR